MIENIILKKINELNNSFRILTIDKKLNIMFAMISSDMIAKFKNDTLRGIKSIQSVIDEEKNKL